MLRHAGRSGAERRRLALTPGNAAMTWRWGPTSSMHPRPFRPLPQPAGCVAYALCGLWPCAARCWATFRAGELNLGALRRLSYLFRRPQPALLRHGSRLADVPRPRCHFRGVRGCLVGPILASGGFPRSCPSSRGNGPLLAARWSSFDERLRKPRHCRPPLPLPHSSLCCCRRSHGASWSWVLGARGRCNTVAIGL